MSRSSLSSSKLKQACPSRSFAAAAALANPQHPNGYIESFNGKFRDECLNEQWIETLPQSRTYIAAWRRDYNEVRPHSSLGRIPPAQLAQLVISNKQIWFTAIAISRKIPLNIAPMSAAKTDKDSQLEDLRNLHERRLLSREAYSKTTRFSCKNARVD